MKKGDRFAGKIQRVDFPNLGRIETPEGDKITVKNGIPGQTVYGYIQKKRSGRKPGDHASEYRRNQSDHRGRKE